MVSVWLLGSCDLSHTQFSDPGVSTFVEELFGTLAANAHCRGNLQSRFLPTALEILQSDDSQLPLGLVAVR